MISSFTDPFASLLNLQRALDAQIQSDWLGQQTGSQGPFPPINVFQQGDDILAMIELPGIDKKDLQLQAKGNTIRIYGKKDIDYPGGVSLHRRERMFGAFDPTITLPVQVNTDKIKAECREGILALFLPRAEDDKPRNINIS